MIVLPERVRERIEGLLGTSPRDVQALGGGCVAEVYRFTAGEAEWVLKLDRRQTGSLAKEGRMLNYLDRHSPLPVPRPIGFDDAYLLMPFIAGHSHWDAAAEEHAAELLASMHDTPAPCFGFDEDTVIGSLPQPNARSGDWLAFFREQRLLAMGRQALDAGQLPAILFSELERFAERLESFLEAPPHPSLLHGDVWSGNVLAKNGRIQAFLDPAIYWGHPEVELAFITLFATFGERFFAAYASRLPLDADFWTVRRPIYTLYPLLVHVRLFGGGYVQQFARILQRFA